MPNETDASKGFAPLFSLFGIRDRRNTEMDSSGKTGGNGLYGANSVSLSFNRGNEPMKGKDLSG